MFTTRLVIYVGWQGDISIKCQTDLICIWIRHLSNYHKFWFLILLYLTTNAHAVLTERLASIHVLDASYQPLTSWSRL